MFKLTLQKFFAPNDGGEQGAVDAAGTEAAETTLAEGAEKPTNGSVKEPDEQHPAEGALELDYDNIKQVNGEFVWTLDPENPTSMVYKGKTLGDLLKSVEAGIKVKDANYLTLKQTKINLHNAQRNVQTHQPDSDLESQLPGHEEILADLMKQNRVELEYLTYTDDQWSELEAKRGAVNTLKLMNSVENIKQQASQKYATQNVMILNGRNQDSETEAVEDLVESYGVTVTEDEYTELLESINSDPKNFERNGLRKSGRIVSAASKLIKEKAKVTETARLSKESSERAATELVTNERGERVQPKPAGSTKPKEEKSFNATKDAAAAIRDAVKSGKLKL